MKADKIVVDEMGIKYSRSMYEQAIGTMVLDYVDKLRPYELSPISESEALRVICKIKNILDSDDLGDSECFHRIDEIIKALDEGGIYTDRHDW